MPSRTPSRTRGVLAATAKAAGIAAAAGVGAGAGWILYSRRHVNHHRPMPEATDAQRVTFRTASAGEVSYYVDSAGAGRPVALVHSINAAASAYEMMPLFEQFRGDRPVYAIDLPGFGFSERHDRVYTRELYTTALIDWIDREIDAQDGVDLVALSLAGEFSARAALERPELFNSLAFLSPTGFDRRRKPDPDRSARIYGALSQPLWSQAFYDLLVTPPSIRHYLKKSFEGPVDNRLASYDYETSHQPGARFAPLYFVSGKLFTPDIADTVYSRVPHPVLVLYDRDAYVDFSGLPGFLAAHPNWRAERIPGTRGLPHFEKGEETAWALESYWRNTPARIESDSETHRRTQPHPA